MKIESRTKLALMALFLSSQVTSAKSFASCNSIESINSCRSIGGGRSLKRLNTFAPPRTVQNSNTLNICTNNGSKTGNCNSRTSRDILSLRAGAIGALPTLSSMNVFFKQYPYAAAFLICGIQASAADLIAQKTSQKSTKDSSVVEVRGGSDTLTLRRPSFEFKRNLAFLFYGGAYQGCFQEHLFNHIFPMIFGESRSPLTVGLKVTFDMLVISPFLCLPVAYLIKGAIYRSTFGDSIRRYVHDVKENALLKTYWSVWYPVQIFNFLIVPKQFRISFVACFSFFWLIMLSTISGKAEAQASQA